jgi:DNA-binding PadR family transcriptional regulator
MRSTNVARVAEVRRRRSLRDLPVIAASQWLVLALVMEKPSYGYEIGERYERRFGTFLPAGRTATYGALDRLDQAGLIESLVSPPAPAPGVRRVRVSYRPTGDASAAHAAWLASPCNAERWHNEMLARIVTAHLQGPSALREQLDRYAHYAELHKQRIDERIAERSAGEQQSLQSLSNLMLLREQQTAVAAQLDWVKRARREADARDGE